MAFDIAFVGGTVVDGTGRPPFVADVATTDGKIAEIGKVGGRAARRIDITGLAIAPGVVDVHSHYDAQVCWDGVLSSSAEHGTTTVIQGNCGVGVAPCHPEERDALLRDLTAIEGMSYEVLNAGIDWQFETFPEYLGYLRRRGLGVNLAAFVPLSPLRIYELGNEARERPANSEERTAIAASLHAAMEAGALGFSLTTTSHHVGYKGRPIACCLADRAELVEYARVLRRLGRGAIQINPFDRTPYARPDELDQIAVLLAESGRPVTFSGAHHRAEDPDAIERLLQQVAPFRAQGGMPQALTRPLTSQVDLRSPNLFAELLPFRLLFDQPLERQREIYGDPAWRAEAAASLRGPTNSAGRWREATVLRAGSERMRSLVGKSVSQIASERGVDPLDAMLDVALEDNLELRYLVEIKNTDPAHLRKHIADPRVMIGLADGGAHVDQLCETGYPTYMFGHWVRREQALSLEHAVKRMTSEPAEYFGLRGRGRVAVDAWADFMIFDPERVDSVRMPTEVRRDLPGAGERLYAKPAGMEYVVVNGAILYESGKHTGALPGAIVADAN